MVLKIKERREALGMSQTQLADAASLSKATVCLFESGGRTPRVQTLETLARVLKCRVADLLGEEVTDGDH